MKKLILVVVFVLLGAFFMYRSQQPSNIQGEIVRDITIVETLRIINSGFVSPYACIWSSPEQEKSVPTRHCSMPNVEAFNVDDFSEVNLLVVYKGLGVNSHFKVVFGKGLRVSSVGRLSGAD